MAFTPPSADEVETEAFTPPAWDDVENIQPQTLNAQGIPNVQLPEKSFTLTPSDESGAPVGDEMTEQEKKDFKGYTPTPDELELYRRPAKGLMKMLGTGGQMIPALLADVGTGQTDQPNVQSVIAGEKPEYQALYEQPGQSRAVSIPGKTSAAMLETIPKMAGVMAAGPAAPLAAGVLFGYDNQGEFHPAQAAIAAALPFVGKWGGALAETIAKRLRVSSEQALGLVNAGGRYASANAVLAAQQLPDWGKMDENQKIDAVAGILSQGLLGLADFRGATDRSGKVNLSEASDLFKQAAERAQKGIEPIQAKIDQRPEPIPKTREVPTAPEVPDAEKVLPRAAAALREVPAPEETPEAAQPEATPGETPVVDQTVNKPVEPPTVEGLTTEKPISSGTKTLWQFTIKNDGPAHNDMFTVPAGATEEQIRAKVLQKEAARLPTAEEIAAMTPDEFGKFIKGVKGKFGANTVQAINLSVTPENRPMLEKMRDDLRAEVSKINSDFEKSGSQDEQEMMKALSKSQALDLKAQTLNEILNKPAKAEVAKNAPVKPAAAREPQLADAGMGGARAGEVASNPTIEEQISGQPLAPENQNPLPPRARSSSVPVMDAIKDFFSPSNIKGFIGGLAGKTFPRTTEAGRQLGELGARWVSSKIAATHRAGVFVADVLRGSGKEGVRFGAALTEDNLRSVKKAYQDRANKATDPDEKAKFQKLANEVLTTIGKPDAPFATEADYQKYLKDPQTQELVNRHKDLWDAIVAPQFRSAMQLDPDTELPSRGLQTGARINLRAVQEGDNPKNAVYAAPRGGLLNTLRRKSPFGIQAKGSAEGYHLNYHDLMENTFGQQDEIANKNELEKAFVKAGQAVIAPPGQQVMIDGRPAKAFPLKRQRVILPGTDAGAVSQNQSIYINSKLAREYEIGAAVNSPPPRALLSALNRPLNFLAISSGTDATVHLLNQMSALATLPGNTGTLLHDSLLSALPGKPDAWVTVSKALVNGFKDNRAQLASLAEIGALREEHEPTKIPVLRQMSQTIAWMDKATRLSLDNTYKRLAQQGLVENSETARREFVNQIGQYNSRSQGYYKRLFRETGFGPFVTAGTTFNTLGVRAATLNPGVKASSKSAALALKANMLTKLVGTASTVMLLNYLMTKDKEGGGVAGRPGVPLGAIDTGKNDKNGRPQYIPIFNMIGAGRGLRVMGVRGLAEGKRAGLPTPVALDAAARDVINSAIAPWSGPPVRFAVSAASGYAPAVGVGRQFPVVPPGQSQKMSDFKNAVIGTSPLAAGVQKANAPGSTGLSEIVKSQLPRLTMQPGKPPEMMAQYPQIVRRAQANSFLEDVIGRARKMEPEARQKYLQESVAKLDPQDRAHAWTELRRRKVH